MFHHFMSMILVNSLKQLRDFADSFKSDVSPFSHSDFEFGDDRKHKYCQSIFQFNNQVRKFLSLSLFDLSAYLLKSQDVYFAGIELHIRNSGGGEIPVHQDNVSFTLTKSKALTAYIVLVDQSGDTGGLGYYDYNIDSPMLPHCLTSIAGFSSSIDHNSLPLHSQIFHYYQLEILFFIIVILHILQDPGLRAYQMHTLCQFASSP